MGSGEYGLVSIDRQLVAEMVQDLVGWCSEAASVGESEMGGN